MTIDREALLAKATWFYRCPNTGEYSGEYCTVRPHDDSNMVPMISVDAVLSALDQPAQEPVAWMVTGRVEQGLSFDREAADNMAQTNGGEVVPLYAAPQPLPAQEPVLWITQAELDSLRRAGVRGYYGFISLIARKDRDDKYSIPLYASPQPTKIPYSKDAQNAVMTLLEQGKVYVDNQGYLSLVKGDVDVVMDTTHPKA